MPSEDIIFFKHFSNCEAVCREARCFFFLTSGK
nr:MAG TPA: hypothetical protein [Caudoviricetes sp.]